jgi:Rieske Fe-S protein
MGQCGVDEFFELRAAVSESACGLICSCHGDGYDTDGQVTQTQCQEN